MNMHLSLENMNQSSDINYKHKT